MLNDNEWKLTLLSLAMFVAGVMGGCGFLMTGSLVVVDGGLLARG